MLKTETITVGSFAMNCYLLYDDESGEAIFIDPGMEADRLIARVEQLDLDLQYIVNTHAHIDHVAETGVVQKHFNVDFYLHREEVPLINSLQDQAGLFGVEVKDIPHISKYIDEGDEIQLADQKGKILHTPGHSPGSISISWPDAIFVGDCLFMGSIGRTDLYKGDYNQLIHSIKTKLLTLPGETTVYSGHGPVTSIGREKVHNPFLQT